MDQHDMKVSELLVSPKTAFLIYSIVFAAMTWMGINYVSASDFKAHLNNFDSHTKTYELDRTDDKMDDLEVQIFNLTELIAQDSTPERRKQLNKYEGDYSDYKQQRACLENGNKNCRRIR